MEINEAKAKEIELALNTQAINSALSVMPSSARKQTYLANKAEYEVWYAKYFKPIQDLYYRFVGNSSSQEYGLLPLVPIAIAVGSVSAAAAVKWYTDSLNLATTRQAEFKQLVLSDPAFSSDQKAQLLASSGGTLSEVSTLVGTATKAAVVLGLGAGGYILYQKFGKKLLAKMKE